MADTAIEITSGTGTNIDTRTEATNGNHRQVVVLGDPSTNAGVAAVDATNGLLVNPGASTVGDNRQVVTTAGTRVQFGSQACKFVIITGLEANTDMVVIGGSTVVASASTRRGIPLTALQQIKLDISNTNLLYIDSVVSGEGVSYAYFA